MDIVRFAFSAPRPTAGNARAATQGSPVIPGANGNADATAAQAAGAQARGTGRTAAAQGIADSRQTRDELQAVLEQVSRHINPERRSLSFRFSEELGRAIVSVYDAETDELIRQIPSEAALRIASTLRELARHGSEGISVSGLLLSDQA